MRVYQNSISQQLPPPPPPPLQGEELITKRFSLLAKEGLGEVVAAKSNFDTPPPHNLVGFVNV